MAFGFGQPRDGVIQLAYTTPDLQASIRQWVADLNVGPWFVAENFGMPEVYYRGTHTPDTRCHLAMAFSGHMQIELIQPADGSPSIYREAIERRGYGFHHFGKACEDSLATAAEMKASGYTEAMLARFPTGESVYFMDAGDALPGMIELLPYSTHMDRFFTAQWRASIGWNGERPVRPMDEATAAAAS